MKDYKPGDWYVFCDICGQRWHASQVTRLSTHTGRGGLIVCPNDVDEIDPGLIPYNIPTEKNIPWTRINHTETSNASDVFDYENDNIYASDFTEYLGVSQSFEVLVTSQDSDVIITSQSVE